VNRATIGPIDSEGDSQARRLPTNFVVKNESKILDFGVSSMPQRFPPLQPPDCSWRPVPTSGSGLPPIEADQTASGFLGHSYRQISSLGEMRTLTIFHLWLT
jgi:hypothetical protein